MVNTVAKPEAQLEDVMAAMDVVDTLRHEQSIAERELDSQGRRERLLQRLRELYTAQGIEVSDRILEEGIDALEQERFEYKPVAPSFNAKLAHLWVSRGRWGKPVLFFTLLCFIFLAIYYFIEVLPEKRLRESLPDRVGSYLSQIKADAKSDHVLALAQSRANGAYRAIKDDDFDHASDLASQLQSISDRLKSEYQIRVVSRLNESSGVWRIPPNNPNARNFYIIVEALSHNGKALDVEVLNEENNKRELVDVWGVRVSESLFYRIAADKQDDGIIQNNVVGHKERGDLEPTFTIDTTGATITEW